MPTEIIIALVKIVVLLGGLMTAVGASLNDSSRSFEGPLRSLSPEPSVLGEKWKRTSGLVVDDINDLSALKSSEQRALADSGLISGLKRARAVAFADFSYQAPGNVVPQIATLRVIVFANEEAALKFWREKYQRDDWEKIYRPVQDMKRAVNVVGFSKRIVLQQNVLLTAHQSIEGDEHQKLLDDCLERLVKHSKGR